MHLPQEGSTNVHRFNLREVIQKERDLTLERFTENRKEQVNKEKKKEYSMEELENILA